MQKLLCVLMFGMMFGQTKLETRVYDIDSPFTQLGNTGDYYIINLSDLTGYEIPYAEVSIISVDNVSNFTDASKVFTNACKKVGIYEDKRTTLHCLRHTFALMKYLETRDLYEVCKRLNHTSIKTTERYSQFSFQRLEQDYPSIVENSSKVIKIDEVTPNKVTPNDSEGCISPLLMN